MRIHEMLASEFSLRDDFPPASYDAWRALATADLEGAPFEQKLVTHTYEGIDIQPVYTRRDHPGEGDPAGFPGLPHFVRGARPLGAVPTGWDLRQEHAHPDLATTNAAILEDLQGGATAAQDVAFGMASAVEYLRAMTRAGLEIDSAARQILFSISLGTHHFLAIAKLRAARRLWSRVVEACGGTPAAGGMRVHARASK